MVSSFSDDTAKEAEATELASVPISDSYQFPASFVQTRLWSLSQHKPDNFIYPISSALRLRGFLKFPALLCSNAALVDRHEILRTSFSVIHDQPLQSIAADLTIPLPLIDLRTLDEDWRATTVEQIMQDEAQAPFHLAQGPLIRTTLLWLEDEVYVLLLTLHQCIADVWSVGIWFNELRMLYRSFAAGEAVPLPELPIQYADYAAWQQEWMQGEILEQELIYWRKQLAGVPASLELPADHPRSTPHTYQKATHPFALTPILRSSLEALSRKQNVTLFMTLLATFQILLARLTNQQDIVVGTPVTGRTQIELEGLIGHFANILLLRNRLLADSMYTDLLKQVCEDVLKAYEHQDLPFDLIVETLQPESRQNNGSFIPALFSLQVRPQISFTLEDDDHALGTSTHQTSEIQVISGDSHNLTKFDLALFFSEATGEDNGLDGAIVYNANLFEEATIARWAAQLQLLLECIAVDPQQPLSTLLSLSEGELQTLLNRWNTLADVWAHVLHIEQPDIYTNFFEAGGDSILSLLAIVRAREAGLLLTPKQIFEHPTIVELARVATATAPIIDEQPSGPGLVPLTPIQHWFFDQQLIDPSHWNQDLLLEIVEPRIDVQLLTHAFIFLLGQHSALTTRFKRGPQDWEQYTTRIEAHPMDMIRSVDLSAMPEDEQERTFVEIATQTHESLNLTDGPLLRVVYFSLGDRPAFLLLVIHHLVVDAVSWRILLEDLQFACQQLLKQEPVQLLHRTTTFKTWATRLQEYARSEEVRQEARYWLADARRKVPHLPVDFVSGPSVNIEATLSSVETSLTIAETDALLHDVAKAYRTQIQEILLTALALACAPWIGRRSLLVDIEGHGREDIIEGVDLSRTVGWFTTIFPVLLDLESEPGNRDLGNAIKTIKEQVRGIPHNGVGYGLLRYLGNDIELRTALQDLPQAEMSFNYLGQFDPLAEKSTGSLFQLAQRKSGEPHSLLGRRSYLLDVVGIVAQKRFSVEWGYSTQLHLRSTIESLAQRYIDTLRALIKHCSTSTVSEYTSSDFSGSSLNQAKLDKIMAKIRANKQT